SRAWRAPSAERHANPTEQSLARSRLPPESSPAVSGRPFRVSKGGGIHRKADSGGHGAKRPPGRGGARQRLRNHRVLPRPRTPTQQTRAYARNPVARAISSRIRPITPA